MKYTFIVLLLLLQPAIHSQNFNMRKVFPFLRDGLPQHKVCHVGDSEIPHPNNTGTFTNTTGSVADLVVIRELEVDDYMTIDGVKYNDKEEYYDQDCKQEGKNVIRIHKVPVGTVLKKDVQPYETVYIAVYDTIGYEVGVHGTIGFKAKGGCEEECGCDYGATENSVENGQPVSSVGSSTDRYDHIPPKKPQSGTKLASRKYLQPGNLSIWKNREQQIFTPEKVLYQIKNSTGLTQIDVINDNSYSIKQFSSGKVGSKDSNGYFTVTGEADTTITYSSSSSNVLNVEHKKGNAVVSNTVFKYNSSSDFWEMGQDIDGDGKIDRYQQEKIKKSGSNTIKTSIVLNSSRTVVNRVRRTYDSEHRLLQERVDPWGAELITNYTYTNGNLTRIDYPDGSFETTTYTADNKVELTIRSSGLFKKYEYNSKGLVSKVIESFNGSSYSTTNSQHKVTLYGYGPRLEGDDGSVDPDEPRLVRVRALGKEISRTYYGYLNGEEHVIQAVTPTAAIDNPGNLWTSTYTNAEGEVTKRVEADGTGTIITYEVEGNTETTTTQSGVFNSDLTAIVQGTESVEIVTNGLLVSTYTFDIASGHLLSSRTVTERDSANREKRIDYLDGSYEMFVYGCCNLDAVRSREGIWTDYTRDSLGRVLTSTKAGVTQINEYNSVGQLVVSKEQGTDGTVRTISSSSYDRAGRLRWTKDALGNQTLYSYAYSNGQTTTTITYPNGTKEIRVVDSEGKLVSLSGNAVFPRSADLDAERVVYDDELKYSVYVRRRGQSENWNDVFYNALTQVYKRVNKSGEVTRRFYQEGTGELIKTQSSIDVSTLFYRDLSKNINIEALDVNNNNQIDYGIDTILRIQKDVVRENNITWKRSRTWLNPDSFENPGLVDNTNKVSNDGLARVNTSITNGISSTFKFQTQLGEDGVVTSTVTRPDGSYTETQTVNGLKAFKKSFNSKDSLKHRTDYLYDRYNRLKYEKDFRNGYTIYSYNDNDQIVTLKTADPDGSSGPLKRQTFTTDYNNMGRRTSVMNPDGSKIFFEYTTQGLIKKSYGQNVYPREYIYDSKGKLKNVQTWKNYGSKSGRNDISWAYNSAGRLVSETDQEGRSTYYTYYSSGLLKEKIDARGVKKLHLYDASGRLKEIKYSDGTPTVKFTYNKWGQLNTVADVSGLKTYKYNGLGQFTGQKWTSGFLKGVETVYSIDSIGRNKKLVRKIAGQTRSNYYSYNNMGLLYKVKKGDHAFQYSYLYKSPKTISKMTVKKSGTTQLFSKRDFDKMMRTKKFSWKAGSQVLSSQNFMFDEFNRREKSTQNDGSVWQYGYDSFGNLNLAVKDHGSNPQEDLSFSYTYNDNGSRKTAGENSSKISYTTNNMQQYVKIARDGLASNISYDRAGNPLTYGDWDLVWDGESRLKSMTNTITGQKLEFAYDYRGFRIWKKVFTSGNVLKKWIGFVYDGDLVTEEINLLDNKKIIRSYTWGLDPAGTKQQVGGIGALLSMEQNGKNYHVVTDAGGNITKLYESKPDSSIALVNSYEYGPFGQLVAKSESVEMPYQFNTKYTDEETGLVYYGFRFYNPVDGRWLNRDPIGVNGGINLYNSNSNNMVNGFVGNNSPLGFVDGMDLGVGSYNYSISLDPLGKRRLVSKIKAMDYDRFLFDDDTVGVFSVELEAKFRNGKVDISLLKKVASPGEDQFEDLQFAIEDILVEDTWRDKKTKCPCTKVYIIYKISTKPWEVQEEIDIRVKEEIGGNGQANGQGDTEGSKRGVNYEGDAKGQINYDGNSRIVHNRKAVRTLKTAGLETYSSVEFFVCKRKRGLEIEDVAWYKLHAGVWSGMLVLGSRTVAKIEYGEADIFWAFESVDWVR